MRCAGIGDFASAETVCTVSAQPHVTGTFIEPRAVDPDGVKSRGAG